MSRRGGDETGDAFGKAKPEVARCRTKRYVSLNRISTGVALSLNCSAPADSESRVGRGARWLVVVLTLGWALTSRFAPCQTLPQSRVRCEPVTEFSIPGPPYAIVAGPDGDLWFSGLSGLGRITTSGDVTLVSIPGSAGTGYLAFDPDKNLWFTEDLLIGRLSPDGLIAKFSLPDGGRPSGIALGPDHDIWFTDPTTQRVGRITPTGSFFEFSVSGYPSAITEGPDGNLWFTESGNRVGRISTTGNLAEFAVPVEDNPFGSSMAIKAGPDGALWFTGSAGWIGRITTAGAISVFPIPRFVPRFLQGITAGPDGNMWFTEASSFVGPGPLLDSVGRITQEGVIAEFPLPTPLAGPAGIASGPDGHLWVAERTSNHIARISSTDPCSRLTNLLRFR